MNREEVFENIEALASKERVERRKEEEKNVIAKTKSEAVEKAKERCEKWSWRKEATIITAEDIIINESEKPNGNN